jgi:hypothetical protein
MNLVRTLPGTIYEVLVPEFFGGYHRYIVTHYPRPDYVALGGKDIWVCSCGTGLNAPEPCIHMRRIQAELALESEARS